MGDHNSKELLKKLVPATQIVRQVMEVGSLDNEDGKATSLRDFYINAKRYVGIDIQKGKNVDFIFDFCGTPPSIYNVYDYFQLIYAISVFEHLDKPWIAAEHISQNLEQNGLLFISVPWVWRYHPYPDDYFRYSFSGIKSLFPGFEWLYEGTCSINGIHKQYKINQKNDDNKEIVKMKGQKYLPYTTINMLGRKL